MIFKPEHIDKIFKKEKTQTRRPVKPGEFPVNCYGEIFPSYVRGSPNEIDAVFSARNYKKWQVGHTYAVQPGRGKKAVGRIRITKIRRERLQDITDRDIKAESTGTHYTDEEGLLHILGYFKMFKRVWDALYPSGPYAWDKNPDVWVLGFEPVKEE